MSLRNKIDEDYKQFPCKCKSKNCCSYIVRAESRWRINKKFAMSNKKNLVNYGVGGYSLDQIFIRYLSFKRHDIEHVYYVFCSNDAGSVVSNNLIKYIGNEYKILKPKFNVTDGFNKSTNKSYRLLKGYWINDQNQKKRIFNKNVGISDASIEYHFERFFKNRGYDVTIYLKLLNGFIIDLVIEKDGVQEAVEFKLSNRNKDEFYNQFMSLEMWFRYKDIYVN